MSVPKMVVNSKTIADMSQIKSGEENLQDYALGVLHKLNKEFKVGAVIVLTDGALEDHIKLIGNVSPEGQYHLFKALAKMLKDKSNNVTEELAVKTEGKHDA